MKLLEAVGVSKRFGGIAALTDVSLDIDASEIVGVIGPNGAGKTTLFNCLLGVEKPDHGRVTFEGHDLEGMPVHRRSRLGIGRTFQRMELFAEMTPTEHLLTAARAQRAGQSRRDLWRWHRRPGELAGAIEILELLGISDIADRPAESLTLGQGRLVELGRALATQPKLLMLDEPSSGLDRNETAELAEVLARVVEATGMGVLLVEHDLDLVKRITRRLYVLDFGRLLESGPTAETLETEAVRHAYLGNARISGVASSEEPAGASAEPAEEGGQAMLELRDVHAAYGPFRALFGVSFEVPRGSAVALVGANGAGKSTVARVASGLVPLTSGTVAFDGHDVSRMRPFRRARLGMLHVPEGRSVFATLTVEENLTLHLRGGGRGNAVAHGLDEAYRAFPQLAERRHQRARTLSGGEQRMLALAEILVDPPRLLVVDELSLGLAPMLIDEVYRALAQIKAAGASLLVVEQHVARALAFADQYVLLSKGRVVASGPAGDAGAIVSYLQDEESEAS